MIDFFQELNPEQLDVVFNGDGPCLVLAGAGSGKTRVITYRVAYLLEQGVAPENILLVTFTNKAAAEMTARMQKITGVEKKLPWAGTFHHIAYKILRFHAPLLGYAQNFTILDTDDSEALLKLSLKKYKIEGTKKFPSASVVHNIISYARNAQLTIDEVLEIKYPGMEQFSKEIKSIADEYTQKKKEANTMDFDDLLVNFLLLLNHPDTCRVYAQKFQYVLVDEYQDTNKIQAAIVDRLASIHKNVLVVGDDAQSIYSFRAADIQNILSFEKKYANAKIFRLETNYRSSQEILDLANNVIANNTKQFKKSLKTLLSSGVRPELHPRMDQFSEAEFITERIQNLLDDGVPAKEVSVLFRAAHHSQMLEMQLMRAGISYDYRGGLRFFERGHVKDILAYLKIINNLADTASWLRVLTHEEGIGPVAAQKLIEKIRAVENIEEVEKTGWQILGEKAKAGWNNFVNIWKGLIGAPKNNPAETVRAVLNSSYIEYLESEYPDFKERKADLEQLAIFAEQYDNLEQFLAEATLQESFSLRGSNRQKITTKEDKIILSTIHQAKGLEWEAVFLLNLSSGGFPNDRAMREPDGLEEERRLFYVAITRAKRKLVLTYPMASGGAGDFLSGPSLFLSEISDGLLDDKSLLNYNTTVLDDDEADVHYIPEDRPVRIKPGSFLRSLDDL